MKRPGDEDFALLKLYEEIGELSQAVLIHRKKNQPEKHVSEEISKKNWRKSWLMSSAWPSSMHIY